MSLVMEAQTFLINCLPTWTTQTPEPVTNTLSNLLFKPMLFLSELSIDYKGRWISGTAVKGFVVRHEKVRRMQRRMKHLKVTCLLINDISALINMRPVSGEPPGVPFFNLQEKVLISQPCCI